MSRAVMKDQDPGEPEGGLILYLAGYEGEKDLLVDAHEVVLDVKLEITGGLCPVPGHLPYKLLKAPNTPMDPLPLPAGIGVVDKNRLPDPL